MKNVKGPNFPNFASALVKEGKRSVEKKTTEVVQKAKYRRYSAKQLKNAADMIKRGTSRKEVEESTGFHTTLLFGMRMMM